MSKLSWFTLLRQIKISWFCIWLAPSCPLMKSRHTGSSNVPLLVSRCRRCRKALRLCCSVETRVAGAPLVTATSGLGARCWAAGRADTMPLRAGSCYSCPAGGAAGSTFWALWWRSGFLSGSDIREAHLEAQCQPRLMLAEPSGDVCSSCVL